MENRGSWKCFFVGRVPELDAQELANYAHLFVY